MHKLLFAALVISMLTACSSSPPEELVKINALHIPVVQNTKSSAAPEELATLHQENKQIIDNLALGLKTDYLLDVKTADIFDDHSQVHQVYLSLSRLDQIRMMNNFYFKEQNFHGLQQVNTSLAPLLRG